MLQHIRLEFLTGGNGEPIDEYRDAAEYAVAVAGAEGGGGAVGVELVPQLPILIRHITSEIDERGRSPPLARVSSAGVGFGSGGSSGPLGGVGGGGSGGVEAHGGGTRRV